MVEWWLLNLHYLYLNSNIFFNASVIEGSQYVSYKWINNYDYGWYIIYSGPALELLDFVDLCQVYFIFKQHNLLNVKFIELANQLITERVFVKSDILNTKSFFVDTLQLDFNSVALGIYSLILISIYFFNFDPNPIFQNNQVTECNDSISYNIPFYFYDFYFYDYLFFLENIYNLFIFF